jgi:RND family efflux transporter MFP subunit
MPNNHPKFRQKAISILVGLIILGTAVGIARYWKNNKLSAKPNTEIVKPIPRVETIQLNSVNHVIQIKAMGNVVPARKISLVSQVKGEIQSLHKNFLPGGIVKKGATLVKINPVDYQLTKLQKQSEVEKAQNDFSLEKGKQRVAKQEYKLLGSNLAEEDQELILRKPQLRLSQSNLTAAKAKLKQAEMDLSRTQVKAPFNALIEEKNADIGSWKNAGSSLASLIGTDQYWVEVSLPVDRLSLLAIPEFNASKPNVTILYYPPAWGNKTRSAVIKRLKPNLDSKVRMAKLIIEVNDPLSFKKSNKNKPKLLMGSFVEVKMAGNTLNNVLEIPRKALRNGAQLWLLKDHKLHITNINIRWKNQQAIYINADDIPPNSQIITSDLSTPVESMLLSNVNVINE